MNDFTESLIKMEPFEKCLIKVDLIEMEEPEEELVEDLNDVWISIDSKALRKNCFLSDEQKKKSKDLNKILYTILKTRFLLPISDLKIDYQIILKGVTNTYLGKILITDDSSRALLKDIIDLQNLKGEPIGISSEYNIRDELSEDFKRRYHLIYLICMNEMSDEEFDLFLNALSKKSSGSQTVFSFYILLNYEKRVKKLQNLKKTSIISGFYQLGGFQCIDHNIVVIDNRFYMNWLIKKDYNNVDNEILERLVRRFVNFLEQIGEFPIAFRYYKSFHQTNRSIAERVFRDMTEIANKRKQSKEEKHDNNFQLLIIDRTIDLITPLTHCLHFRPFVFNELEKEYQNDMNPEYRKLNSILANNISQIEETFRRIKDLYFNVDTEDELFIEKFNSNIENGCQVMNKIKNKSYSQLLTIEKSILETKSSLKSDNNLQKKFEKLFSQNDREITNNDLIRVLIINDLFSKNAKKEDIKKGIKQTENGQQIDWTEIEDFLKLTKKLVNIEDFSSTNPKISRIVSNYFEGKLSEDTYPFIYKKKWTPDQTKETEETKQKLILFILGGLSYNDLISIPEKYQNDVIICSNSLITPKMFINSIIYE